MSVSKPPNAPLIPDGEVEVRDGEMRLEVRLYGPATVKDTGYGPREERAKLVDLDLPVTWMAWGYIRYLLEQYTTPTIVITGPEEKRGR